MKSRKRFGKWILCGVVLASGIMCAQDRPAVSSGSELRLRVLSSLPGKHRAVPAVIWLEPLADTTVAPFLPHHRYTLLQKNRTFIPHLQVIPAGSVVEFPNRDPFFHNVFSLFDGKRFNLQLARTIGRFRLFFAWSRPAVLRAQRQFVCGYIPHR